MVLPPTGTRVGIPAAVGHGAARTHTRLHNPVTVFVVLSGHVDRHVPASLWACVDRFMGTSGEPALWHCDRLTGCAGLEDRAGPRGGGGQRWRAIRAPKPVACGGKGSIPCRTSHPPRRYPQSGKRILVESAKADEPTLRRWDRKNGHAPQAGFLLDNRTFFRYHPHSCIWEACRSVLQTPGRCKSSSGQGGRRI